jgi:hypothetical protein
VLSVKSRHIIEASALLEASLLFAACGSSTVAPSSPTGSKPLPSASVASSIVSASASASASAWTTVGPSGFAFSADEIVAYYQSQGYGCEAQQPSPKAPGYFVRTCTKVDDAGRTRVIGVVTDPRGDLADGFASIQGTASETILAPIDALQPLAGFLGATLGQEDGAGALPWLGNHLGDAYSDTKIGPITLSTYTNSPDDHSKLYVEVANQAYADAAATGTP